MLGLKRHGLALSATSVAPGYLLIVVVLRHERVILAGKLAPMRFTLFPQHTFRPPDRLRDPSPQYQARFYLPIPSLPFATSRLPPPLRETRNQRTHRRHVSTKDECDWAPGGRRRRSLPSTFDIVRTFLNRLGNRCRSKTSSVYGSRARSRDTELQEPTVLAASLCISL